MVGVTTPSSRRRQVGGTLCVDARLQGDGFTAIVDLDPSNRHQAIYVCLYHAECIPTRRDYLETFVERFNRRSHPGPDGGENHRITLSGDAKLRTTSIGASQETLVGEGVDVLRGMTIQRPVTCASHNGHRARLLRGRDGWIRRFLSGGSRRRGLPRCHDRVGKHRYSVIIWRARDPCVGRD